MNRMRILCFLCVFVMTVACIKTKEDLTNPMLIGSWHPETAPDGRAIIFQSNSELIYKQWDTLLTYRYKRFIINNDSTLTFIGLTTKSIGFRIEGTELHLEGACITNCSERLYKILPL